MIIFIDTETTGLIDFNRDLSDPCQPHLLELGVIDRFVRLLWEYNRQREKSFDEKLREEVVSLNSDQAYESLIEQRTKRAKVQVASLTL